MAYQPLRQDEIDPVQKWLVSDDLGRKLSAEGFELLKSLYRNTLPHGVLSNRVQQPRDLYDLPQQQGAPPLSQQDSLALLVRRLCVLAPQQSGGSRRRRLRELRKKDLGAQDCLNGLGKYGVLTRTPALTIEISQESKLLECLVRRYVNMTPNQRRALRETLGRRVDARQENFTVYEIFSDLFTGQTSQNRCQNIVDLFVTSLDEARAGRNVYIELRRELDECLIPHGPIPIPGMYTRHVRIIKLGGSRERGGWDGGREGGRV